MSFTDTVWQTSPSMAMTIPVLCPSHWNNQFKNNKWSKHDSCHHLYSWCQWIFIETRMFLKNNIQFNDECVIPNCLHSIPSQFVTTPNGLYQFITNKYSSLSFADNPHISLSLFQEYLLCNWELIHQKTSFHQSWTIVSNKCLFLLFL